MGKRVIKKAQGRRYTEAEKLTAVQILRAAGGTMSADLLSQIRSTLGASTLDWKSVVLWSKSYDQRRNAQQTDEASSTDNSKAVLLDFQTEPALTIVEHTFRKYAERANDERAVTDTDGKDAARVMVDMAKLMQLLQGLPTEIVGLTAEFYKKALAQGRDPQGVMRALINEMDAEPAENLDGVRLND